MKKSFVTKSALAAAIALILSSHIASAATETDTFAVTATVANSCTVSAADLAFGPYIQTAAVPTDGTTTVTVNCTLLAPYDIGLNAGTGTGATVANRIMTAGTDELNYSLYQDLARTTLWGDTVNTDTVDGTGTGLDVPHVVYGRVFADQGDTAPAGSYTDTINVTVTY